MKIKGKSNHKRRDKDLYLPKEHHTEDFNDMYDVDRKGYLYDSANKCYDQDEW